MGLFGRGIAFGQQFIPRDVFRFRCGGPMLPTRSPISFNFHERITVQQGPTGIWGALYGFFMGYAATRAMSADYSSMYGPVVAQGASTGGAASAGAKEDNSLKNLIDFHGSRYTIKAHPTKEDIYQAVSKDGTEIIEGNYDELCNKLLKNKESEKKDDPSEKTEDELKAKAAADQHLELKDGKYMKDGKEYVWDSASKTFKDPEANPNENHGNETPGSTPSPQSHKSGHQARVSSRSQGSGSHGVKVPEDWYKAPTGGDGQSMIQKGTLRAGMSARQVTDIILNNKVNYLSAADRNKLAAEILHYNPSIFKNGKVVEGADLSKLDLPSVNYIKNKYVESRKVAAHNGTGTYTNKSGQTNNITKTVTSSKERRAKLENGKWHYYAKDGTELKESRIPGLDKDLWNKTHPATKQIDITNTNLNNH